MLVDEIFALYLYRMSNRINQSYYKIVLAYVIFFRECLNEYGWGKKIESESIKLRWRRRIRLGCVSRRINTAGYAASRMDQRRWAGGRIKIHGTIQGQRSWAGNRTRKTLLCPQW